MGVFKGILTRGLSSCLVSSKKWRKAKDSIGICRVIPTIQRALYEKFIVKMCTVMYMYEQADTRCPKGQLTLGLDYSCYTCTLMLRPERPISQPLGLVSLSRTLQIKTLRVYSLFEEKEGQAWSMCGKA